VIDNVAIYQFYHDKDKQFGQEPSYGANHPSTRPHKTRTSLGMTGVIGPKNKDNAFGFQMNDIHCLGRFGVLVFVTPSERAPLLRARESGDDN
jgi:hypothetical protein